MNNLTKKSISLLLSGTMVLGGVASGYTSLAVETNDILETIETKTLSNYNGSCGENLSYTFNESTGLLEIFGSGALQDFDIYGSHAYEDDGDKRPWDSFDNLVKKVVINDGITGLGEWSFAKLENLKVVSLPSSLKYISDSAFRWCTALESINISDGLTNIGDSVFYGCNSLESINMPDSVTDIGSWAFWMCSNLTDVYISNEVEKLMSRTFMDCVSLVSVTIPPLVTTINNDAFAGCTQLEEVSMPKSVTYIGFGAFSDCLRLTDVYYEGSEEDWNAIDIKNSESSFSSNQSLLDATIHFNSISLKPNLNYTPLPTATLHTSYLTGIHDINSNSTLISGNLPKGLGLYEDGVIGGIPQETGTFEFVIATSEGEVGYSITVEAPTAQNVEANNDFDIIERVPTVDSNEKEYIFEVTGEFSDFLNVYLDGELLVKDVHYFSEEGSTKITIAAQTMSQLDSGSHTINAVFTTTNTTITPSSSSGSASSGTITTTNSSKSANVESVAQVFEKTVEPAPMMAMPFTDVAVSDWHYQYVRYMYDTSTFSGVTDTTYEPNTGMTRAMMAVVFYGMADKPSTGSANFSDVADGEWYADAVNWISTSGIDDSIGTFRPTDLITREETAEMMYNFCTDQGIFIPLTTSRTPSDMNSVSETAKNAVNILFSKGIFAGDDANNFNPHNTSTRAEISAMMRTFMWATV